MTRVHEARQALFDATPEIFGTGTGGRFLFPLKENGTEWLDTGAYDEARFVLSMWHPSPHRTIDLDRAYIELQGRFDPQEDRWIKIAEIEPIVPAYDAGATFDGWIVLPVLAARSAYRIAGAGLEARARLQIRSSAYFVA